MKFKNKGKKKIHNKVLKSFSYHLFKSIQDLSSVTPPSAVPVLSLNMDLSRDRLVNLGNIYYKMQLSRIEFYILADIHQSPNVYIQIIAEIISLVKYNTLYR